MKSVVLFDLDNTLYPEFSFVTSGMQSVARYLHARHGVDLARTQTRLFQILQEQGRGKVFDRLLSELGMVNQETPLALLFVYRTHRPVIHLYEDAHALLATLRTRGLRLGLVTDGLASVQHRKIAALNLTPLLDEIVCTGDLGEGFGKPSPVPFEIALQMIGSRPEDAVYIGDDDSKDFSGPHALGMDTIQIIRPGERTLRTGAGKATPAKRRVNKLKEIEEYFN